MDFDTLLDAVTTARADFDPADTWPVTAGADPDLLPTPVEQVWYNPTTGALVRVPPQAVRAAQIALSDCADQIRLQAHDSADPAARMALGWAETLLRDAQHGAPTAPRTEPGAAVDPTANDHLLELTVLTDAPIYQPPTDLTLGPTRPDCGGCTVIGCECGNPDCWT